MNRTAAALVAAWALGALALACGAPRAPAPATSAFAESDRKKDEILDLWMQVREWRHQAGLPGVEPSHELKQKYRSVPLSKIRRVCEDKPEPSQQCSDVCNIADAICDNAEQICRIAKDLGDDSWANDKCRSAKASCKEAKDRCCECETQVESAAPAAPAAE